MSVALPPGFETRPKSEIEGLKPVSPRLETDELPPPGKSLTVTGGPQPSYDTKQGALARSVRASDEKRLFRRHLQKLNHRVGKK